MTTGIMGQRALNRALLARQMLLERRSLPALEVIEHLVGMQAQAPKAPYIGLWTRLKDFRSEELVSLMYDRKVVRIALMRNTVHLVTAGDCLMLRPLAQIIFDRDLRTNTTFAPPLRGMDIEAIVAAGRELVEELPRTNTELGELLKERWPGCDAASLAFVIRSQVPLVQVPPRGIWGEGGQVTCTSAETWLGQPLQADPSREDMVLRYLAAFGPATVRDIQQWCGLTRLREVVERLRPRLITFGDEAGRELFDLPDAPRPDPETPAPVRFVPEYDNLLLSHDDRSRVIADEYRSRVFIRGAALAGGFVCGAWKVEQTRHEAVLRIELFEPVSKRDRDALAEEGERLVRFVGENAGSFEVRFVDGL